MKKLFIRFIESIAITIVYPIGVIEYIICNTDDLFQYIGKLFKRE